MYPKRYIKVNTKLRVFIHIILRYPALKYKYKNSQTLTIISQILRVLFHSITNTLKKQKAISMMAFKYTYK